MRRRSAAALAGALRAAVGAQGTGGRGGVTHASSSAPAGLLKPRQAIGKDPVA
jgi:hypothetical protein